MLQPPFENIEDLHEYVFQILLKIHEEDNNFMFTLRQPHHFINTKTKHWFYGENDKSLYFSCWASVNTQLNKPVYLFSVNLEGRLSLILNPESNREEIIVRTICEALDINKHYDSLINIGESAQLIYIKDLMDEKMWNYKISIKNEEFQRRLDYIQKKRGEQKAISEKRKQSHNSKLKHLSLQNIGHFSHLEMEFHPKITCIFGENGSGKSTILRAIGLNIIGENALEEQNKKIIENLLKINGQSEGFAEYEIEGLINLSYLPNIDLPDQKEDATFTLEYKEGVFSLISYQSGAILADKTDFPLLILGFSQKQTDKGNQEEDKNPSKAGVKDLQKLVYNEADNRFATFEKWILQLYGAANEAKLAGKSEPKESKIIQKIFEIISEVTGKTVSFLMASAYREKVWVRTDDAPNGIPLSMVSQGYANVFGWIGYFMKRLAEVNPVVKDFTQCPAIVIIDEIDTYLHPNWQENILRVMADKFPNVQFIVSTHSLFVYGSIPHDYIKIYRLEKEENEIVCNEITENLYGVDRNEGAESLGAGRRYKEALLRIDSLMNLIYQNKLVEAEKMLNESFGDMNPKDVELMKARTLLNAKKRLLGV